MPYITLQTNTHTCQELKLQGTGITVVTRNMCKGLLMMRNRKKKAPESLVVIFEDDE